MTTTNEAKTTRANGTDKAAKSQKTFQDINDMMGEGTEAVEKAYKAGTEFATENYEKMIAMAQENVESAMKAGTTGFKDNDELTSFNKDNVDALVKSGTVLSQGLQAFSKSFADLTRLSMEQNMNAVQAFWGCKTIADVSEINSQIVKKNYDQAIKESRKLSDMSVKLTEEVATPLAERYTVAVEKFSKGFAA